MDGLGEADLLGPGGRERDDKGRWVEAGWVAGKQAGELLPRDAMRAEIAVGRSGEDANDGRVLDFHP